MKEVRNGSFICSCGFTGYLLYNLDILIAGICKDVMIIEQHLRQMKIIKNIKKST